MEPLCRICNGEMVLFAKNKDLQKKSDENEYTAYECKNCTILFQVPYWKPEETHRFYQTTYYAHTETAKIPRSIKLLDFYLSGSFKSKLFSPFFKHKLFPFLPGIQNAKTILDVGCGKGVFLDLMKKHNKKTYGIEPSDNAKAIAEKNGHNMLDSNYFFAGQQDIKVDLITMFQVAEHLSATELLEGKIFSKMYDALEYAGQLVIETPSYDCDYAKRYRSAWRALELPRHLVIFSPKSLCEILQKAGFTTEVHIRVSPIDVRESFKLKFKQNNFKEKLSKFWTMLRIVLFQKNNSSLLTVIATKR